eukprot:SAG11_NODE_3532_length_2388_cov_2.694190_3_plen_70_part_00
MLNSVTILAGLTAVVLVVPKAEPSYTLKRVWDYFGNPSFLIFVAVMTVLLIALLVLRNCKRMSCFEVAK